MEGFTYHLAQADGDLVAGLMEMPDDAGGMPPFWMIYFAVDDADKAVADIEAAGGKVHRAPADIPGTGRFAVVGDPQGAGFGVLQPAPMEAGPPARPRLRPAEGRARQLERADDHRSGGGLRLLQRPLRLGEGRGRRHGRDGDLPALLPRRRRHRRDDGARQRADAAPGCPTSAPTASTAAIERIEAAGGKLAHGPMEVPGGAFIAVAEDPQGAWFAVVGPKEPS